jgi:hypothetical protein
VALPTSSGDVIQPGDGYRTLISISRHGVNNVFIAIVTAGGFLSAFVFAGNPNTRTTSARLHSLIIPRFLGLGESIECAVGRKMELSASGGAASRSYAAWPSRAALS